MFPVDLGTTDGRIQDVKAHDGVAGFRVSPDGPAPYHPRDFWIMPLAQGARAERVATQVVDFVMLGGGTVPSARRATAATRCVSEEALFRTPAAKVSWNVLDGVERLAPLDKAFDDRKNARDQLSVTLIGGFGGVPRDALALAVFDHRQDEPIARITAPPEEKQIVDAIWRRAIVITSDGQRYMTDLLRDRERPDEIWLHDSGRVLTGKWSWDGPGPRGVKVVETQLRLQEQPPTPK